MKRFAEAQNKFGVAVQASLPYVVRHADQFLKGPLPRDMAVGFNS